MIRSCNAKLEPERHHVPKNRIYLMCRNVFVSGHPGERICRKCKGVMVW